MSEDNPTMTAEELGLEPEIEVNVDDEGTTPPKREIAPEEGIEELRAKLSAQEKARKDAEDQAAQATHAARYAYTQKEESDVALVQSALQQVDQEQAQLRAKYAAAAKAGNYDQQADIMLEMQQNVANKQQLELGLEALKDRVVQARQQAQQPPQRPAQTDPVEMVASQLTPASAKWVRAHPEFATDDEKKNEMIAAHYKAAAKKIKADTPEYFAFIEETLGLDGEPPREAPKPAPRQPAPPPPAPARGNGGGNRPGTMTLSAHQREAAKLAGLTDEEYAQNLVSLRKEGRIGTTH